MRDGDGFGKTEACRETKEGGGLASAKPKLTKKRRKGALVKLTVADNGE